MYKLFIDFSLFHSGAEEMPAQELNKAEIW